MKDQDPSSQASVKTVVDVIAPARLHLGFIDMHGGLGRSYGSLGLCLGDIVTHVRAVESEDVIISGASGNRASAYAGQILEYLNIDQGVEMIIKNAIPEHAGLGSGTQLSLAVGTAIAKLYKKPLSTRKIAEVLGRGARSGIGVGAFSMGGFMVDGGRGKKTDVPPIISNIYFPESWRILLIFDHEMEGINGQLEKQVFRQLPSMNKQMTEYLCRITLMQALPALAEEDCHQFGKAITEIQQRVGDHFASIQGGRFCSPYVARILTGLLQQGATGIGQSSWGPTGFAIFANETQAYHAQKKVREEWQDQPRLSFRVCKARNEKAEVNIHEQSLAEKTSINHTK